MLKLPMTCWCALAARTSLIGMIFALDLLQVPVMASLQSTDGRKRIISKPLRR